MMSPFHRHDLRPLVRSMALLYGSRADHCMERLSMMAGRYGLGYPQPAQPYRWTQRDAVLITYGDMVRDPAEHPLVALRECLDVVGGDAFNTVHILPFFPSSSDDGFSVVHFRRVDPELGQWADVQELGKRYRLMVDLVLNHASRQSGWFKDFELGISPARDYFITADQAFDVSQVVRPRSHPVLTPVQTREGRRQVWTTFSTDQVDLDFSNPDVLFELLDILLYYIAMGARIIRLDAIAYLWKRSGTTCIHLDETHEVVKVMREVVEMLAPDTILLTETNVPHAENVSYFGQGDEAHMVYQFSLPPLLLHALVKGDARHLSQWAASLAPPPEGCTFLNFTASHDGIGVRPLQGLVSAFELDDVILHVKNCGGQVSMKRNSDNTESPYELNITWFDAMSGASDEAQEMHFRRFICSQAVPLALQGIPAVYFHALTATPNDVDGVTRTGRARSINRHKWTKSDLMARLGDAGSNQAKAVTEIRRLLELRSRHPAFHPDGPQRVLQIDERVFAVERTAPDGSEIVVALHNLTPQAVELGGEAFSVEGNNDLIQNKKLKSGKGGLRLDPYQVMWLARSTAR